MASRGHHNGRVMREWWDLPTASSARPFACEVRCQREQDLPVVGPTALGLYGDEPQMKGDWRFSIKQSCRTAISFGMALEWKIKTIKQKSIVSSLRAFKHLEGGRKMKQSDGSFLYHFHLTKGCYCVVSRADMVFCPRNILDFECRFAACFR